jgi:uncharacterized membrane protein YoaT (DUF817 family)
VEVGSVLAEQGSQGLAWAAARVSGQAWGGRQPVNLGAGWITVAAADLLAFGLKQAWACLFGGLMLGLLLVTGLAWPPHAALARYDFLVLAAVCIQAAMLLLKLESPQEFVVILAFHLVGTIMELFKTSAGSWLYPEPSLLRLGAVPLFSGFMYGAVGSYIARVWRVLDFRFDRYPRAWMTWLLASAIYVNFFSHHWLPDIRWLLFGATALVFGRTRIWYRPRETWRSMPLVVGFGLVALFIWFAENLGTFSHAWIYPSQRDGWTLVSPAKMGSWLLLMIISFVLVSLVRRPRPPDRPVTQLRRAEESRALAA